MLLRCQIILIAMLTLSSVCSSSTYADYVFYDPIDDNDGWNTDDIHWTTGVGGLSPSAGTTYWGSTFNQSATVGLSKDFALTVEPGKYTLTVDVSAPFGDPLYDAVAYSDFTEFGLTGITSSPTVISAVTPPESTPVWTTWTFSYLVDEESSDIGNTIGFSALLSADDYNVMVDNLTITHAVPEPASITLFGMASCITGFAAWRRRRKQKAENGPALDPEAS